MTNTTFSNGHALIIGVGADLAITVQDANALNDVLIDPHRAAYPPEQVALLTEAQANRWGILDAFDQLIERVRQKPESTVIVYFSGHGGRIERPNKPAEYFLVPHGYDPSRRAETAVAGLEFTKKIEAIQARKLVVLLDCCHAGGVPALKEPGEIFVKSPPPPDLLDVLASGSGRVVVASSHEKEYSYTGSPYSVFTTCLLEALQGKAIVNEDGFARILDVLIYLFKHVPERAPGPQHPFVKKVLDLGDNFPLCYYAGGSKQVPGGVPSSALVSADTSLTPGQRRRLRQKHNALEQEWDLRSEKVRQMREALAIETSVNVKFQLEKQLLDEEARLAQLDSELDEIEQMLLEHEGSESTQRKELRLLAKKVCQVPKAMIEEYGENIILLPGASVEFLGISDGSVAGVKNRLTGRIRFAFAYSVDRVCDVSIPQVLRSRLGVSLSSTNDLEISGAETRVSVLVHEVCKVPKSKIKTYGQNVIVLSKAVARVIDVGEGRTLKVVNKRNAREKLVTVCSMNRVCEVGIPQVLRRALGVQLGEDNELELLRI